MSTADRRTLFTILDEAGTYALRAKHAIGIDPDGPLTIEALKRAVNNRIQAIAALCEAAVIMDRMRMKMIVGTPVSELALDGAIDKMIDSGDLDLDDEDRDAADAAIVAQEQDQQVRRTIAATVVRMNERGGI